MTAYIIRRVLWGIVLLILVCALTFILFNVLPGANPAQLRAGRNASPAIIHHLSADGSSRKQTPDNAPISTDRRLDRAKPVMLAQT